jgi:hypothetical protein
MKNAFGELYRRLRALVLRRKLERRCERPNIERQD